MIYTDTNYKPKVGILLCERNRKTKRATHRNTGRSRMGYNNLLPFLGMVMAILSQSGGMVINKAAMTDGMNKYVMAVYSFALSTCVLLPLALLQYRFFTVIIIIIIMIYCIAWMTHENIFASFQLKKKI